jgi:signal transduction histidine kinase
MLSRTSLIFKIVASAAIAMLALGALQIWLLSRGVPAAAVAGVLVLAPIAAWIETSLIIRLRYRAVIDAVTRVADGELDLEMPPAPDVDLVPMRDAFHTMAANLRAMTASLRHADAQRRRLFADLAHELATPTSTLLGVVDALRSPDLCPDDATRARLLTVLDHESTQLEHLVHDLRDLAGLDDPDVRLRPERIDVGALARAAVERLGVAAPDRAPLRCDAVPAPVDADPARIDQVLVNLLTNARRHTPDHGSIELAVERHGAWVRIVVEDSGEGVPDELLPMLGQRLFRADSSRTRRTGGSGIGLSIVSAIVHRHHGRLTFARARLGGLRAVVDLPAAPDG